MPAPSRPLTATIIALCLGLIPVASGAKEGLAGAFLAAKIAAANADYRAADLWYQRALALDPSNIELLNGAMIAALSLGEIERASDLAAELHGLNAANQTTLLARMAGAAERGDFAEIIEIETLEVSAGSLQDDLLAGWALIGLGQMNDGIARFDKVAQMQGLAGFGLYHKAIALALAGNFDGAAAALAAPEAGPQVNARRGAILQAEVLSQIGQTAQAADLLRQRFALGQDARVAEMIALLDAGQALPISGFKDASSGLAEVFFTVAAALGTENDPTYTLLQARIASDLRPDDSEALLLTASVLEKLEQFDLAAETYGQIAPDHPDYTSAQIGRSAAVFSAGRGEESLQILKDLAAAFPTEFDVQVALGQGLRRAEQFEAAITAYDAALALLPQILPQHWAIFYSRGIAYDNLRQYDAAEADFRTALELNPNQPNVLNYLGYSLVDRGEKLEEALGMIQRAVAARPDSGYIIDSLAWALYRLGRYSEALAPMERAAQLEPVDPIVTDHLGDVYWANGRQREAMFQWRRALSFEPTEKDAERIRKKLEIGLDAVRASEGAPPFPDLDAGGL
jgi:tetratricopeptide (TPR) repeat protein